MPARKRNRAPIITPNILVLEGLWSDTSDAVRASGGYPVEVTPWEYDRVEKALLSGYYDGMILTGGSDINPELYGEKPHHSVYGVDGLRDAVEYHALEIARELNMPVLGICRGSQIMTAYMGGKLTQDISGHRGSKHWVNCTSEGRTFRRACNSREIAVISLHHQCVRRPGPEMRIAARAMDGTPEAVESKDGLMLGVQFHPELNALENPQSFSIFRWLIESASRRAGGRPERRRFRTVRRANATKDTTYSTPSAGAQKLLPPAEESGTSSSTTGEKAVRRSRKAGDPAIPSMRPNQDDDGPTMTEMVTLIESSTGETPTIIDSEGSILSTAVECDGSCAYGICGCPEYEHQYSGAITQELQVCPQCGLIFDYLADKTDHIEQVHGRDGWDGVPFANASDRYPELEPPPGHPAWDGVTY